MLYGMHFWPLLRRLHVLSCPIFTACRMKNLATTTPKKSSRKNEALNFLLKTPCRGVKVIATLGCYLHFKEAPVKPRRDVFFQRTRRP